MLLYSLTIILIFGLLVLVKANDEFDIDINTKLKWNYVNDQEIYFELKLINTPNIKWIALGCTTAIGLGDSFMQPNVLIATSSAVVADLEKLTSYEYDIFDSDKDSVNRHDNPYPTEDAIQECLYDECSTKAFLCVSDNGCNNGLDCMKNHISNNINQYVTFNNTDVEQILECGNELGDGLGKFLDLLTCYVEKCDKKIQEDLQDNQHELHIRNQTFWHINDETVLSFIATSQKIGYVDLDILGANTFMYAYGSKPFPKYHGKTNRGAFSLNLSTGVLDKRTMPTWLLVHISLMIAAFGFLFPIGLCGQIIGKYVNIKFRNPSTIILCIALCLVTISIILAGSDVFVQDAKPHHIVGLCVYTLVLVNMLYIFFKPKTTKTKDDLKHNWEQFFTYLLLCLAGCNMILGFQILKDRIKVVAYPEYIPYFIAIVFAFSLVLTVFHFVMIRLNYKDNDHSNNEDFLVVSVEKKSSNDTNPQEEAVKAVSLSFHNISYFAPQRQTSMISLNRNKKPKKQLLHSISGYCPPYSLTAIIGSSGAGKTTLLNVLSLKYKSKNDIRVNNSSIKVKSMKKISGYVTQEDTFFDELTVYETFLFAAKMLLPKTYLNHRRRILKILKQLRLDNSKNTLVRYLSGGEKRRLSIALKIIASPSILFLDEVTSGLDFSSALAVIRILREIANEGRVILCTIHQPSAPLFENFSHVLLLANQGRMIYSGTRLNASKFFTENNYIIPTQWNAADWFIHVINSDSFSNTTTSNDEFPDDTPIRNSIRYDMGKVDEILEKLVKDKQVIETYTKIFIEKGPQALDTIIKKEYNVSLMNELFKTKNNDINVTTEDLLKLINNFKDSQYYKEIENTKTALQAVPIVFDENESLYKTRKRVQVYYLVWRNFLITWRNPQILRYQVISNIILGIIIGSLYSNLSNSGAPAYALSMAIVIIIGIIAMSTIANLITVAYHEKLILFKDLSQNLYSPYSWFLSKNIISIPVNFITGASLVFICYFWVGLSAPGFGFFLFTTFIIITLFDGYAMCIALISDSENTAFALSNLYSALSMFFSGIFIQRTALPAMYVPFYYLSPVSYAFNALLVNEFEGGEYEYWIDVMGIITTPPFTKFFNLLIVAVFALFFRLSVLLLIIFLKKE